MYQLVIVDDEFEIRNGLSNYFPWEELGFSISGVFADGFSAIAHISTHPTDVLLTDIRMPNMDGLELIKRIKTLSPQTVSLILSGHKDFEYAREGIALGVRHFIVKPTKYRQLAQIFTSIKTELDAKEQNGGNLHSFAKSVSNTPNPNGDTSEEDDSLIIQAVKRYINTHLAEASLERAADVVRLNPNYLSTYFRTNTGQYFGDYLTSCRMQEACKLLVESSMRINEIADAVGYTNATSFSRAFKSKYDMSPKEWRIRHGLFL